MVLCVVRVLSRNGVELSRKRRESHTDSLITGQRVGEAKAVRIREMRREMMPEERMLWERLRHSRLDGFHCRRQRFAFGFILDLYCHAARLAVEVDGAGQVDDAEHDAARDHVLKAHNLQILRVANDEVRRDLDSVVAKIAALCHHHVVDHVSHRAPPSL